MLEYELIVQNTVKTWVLQVPYPYLKTSLILIMIPEMENHNREECYAVNSHLTNTSMRRTHLKDSYHMSVVLANLPVRLTPLQDGHYMSVPAKH